MQKKIKAIILDWAGTAIDYGCFALVEAFVKAFEFYGISPTLDETRAPMGMQKRTHIARMLDGERLAKLWMDKYGSPHTEKDVGNIYGKFEPALFEVLEQYAEPLPGVLDTVKKIRDMGIAIGSTTGYTKAMMDVVVPLARKNGYSPDCLICPDDVSNTGRPFPYMVWRNLEQLKVADIREVIKIGDTAADMEEGKNAGCICAGVLRGSSMLGLSEKEVYGKNHGELDFLLKNAEKEYRKAGADYVLRNITELPKLIESLNKGERKHV